MSNEKLNASLQTIQSQIEKFDNKASFLIAIISIIFAISLDVLDIFRQMSSQDMTQKLYAKYILMIVFLLLYLISFIIEMILLILVVYPRKKRKGEYNSILYYLDISKMTKEEIKQLNLSDSLENVIEQLSVNAKICAKKHKYFATAIWCMIPLGLFLIITVIISVI